MASALMSRILRGSMISAAAAVGIGFTVAQAQPYYDQPYAYDQAYAYDYAPGVTVHANPYRGRRAPNGAPVETVTASRVVPIDDLDLNSGWGQHVMRQRIERAATDACHDLDMMPGYVPDVGENDADCYNRAVGDALANAPVGVDTSYYGY